MTVQSQARADVQHALALLETAVGHDSVHGVVLIELLAAITALRNADAKLRPPLRIVDDPLADPGFSVKVGAFHCVPDDPCGQEAS